jgi:alkanesulfonate monooxygenase SsuD/methylene tetrahydromethanopterin reductase-like flavin-dependent oxidoreductase (luciferase family)
MEAEFRVLGLARRDRAAISDETLAFLHRCFANDEVEVNGQRFLFRPRPSRPPILVGGAAPHALRRAARFGDGWMPMGKEPEALRSDVALLRELMAAAGNPAPEVVVLTALPLADPEAAMARARAFADVGATRLVHAARYEDTDAFRRAAEVLTTRIAPALTA